MGKTRNMSQKYKNTRGRCQLVQCERIRKERGNKGQAHWESKERRGREGDDMVTPGGQARERRKRGLWEKRRGGGGGIINLQQSSSFWEKGDQSKGTNG